MAWIKSKKDFAILNSNEEGKNIIKDAPELTDDELESRIDEFFDNNNFELPDEKEVKTTIDNNEENKNDSYKFVIKVETRGRLRSLFKYVFRKKDEEMFNDFFDTLNECSDEQKALFIQAMNKSINNVYQGKGEGYFSHSERKIILDRNQLVAGECYVKNGVVFHEFGHCIDWTIGGEIKGGTYASCSYIGEDGMTMEQALDEDVKSVNWEQIKKSIEEAEQKQNSSSELETIKQQLEELQKQFDDFDIRLKQKRKEIIKKDMIEKFGIDPIESGFDSMGYLGAEQKGVRKQWDYYINNYSKSARDIPELSQEYEEMLKKDDKLRAKRRQIMTQKHRDWGDVSDIYSGCNKKSYGFGFMGHTEDYWNERGHNAIVKECFAEMYQGITVNPRSYENMKNYFPKASKVFEEIISKFGKEAKESDEQ